MFYQTDPELQFQAKSDCYIFDILKIHEIVGKHEFTREQVKYLRKISTRVEFIGNDGYINEKGISGLAIVASGITRNHVYIRRVSSAPESNFLIAKFTRIEGKKKITHFVLMKNLTEVLFDPWSEYGARTTKIGVIEDWRFIWAEAV